MDVQLEPEAREGTGGWGDSLDGLHCFASGAGSESKMRVPVAKGPADRRKGPCREALGLRC